MRVISAAICAEGDTYFLQFNVQESSKKKVMS